MKKILVICMLAFGTLLGGCGTVRDVTGAVVQPDFASIIAQVQSYTKIACGFVPTASTIINIIGGAVPGATVATSIAEAVCAAISPPMLAGRKAFVAKTVKGYRVTPGAVNGVRIEGDRQ